MKLIYNLGVRLYVLGVRLAALRNDKAKKWVTGRKEVWRKIGEWNREEKPVYWFHCASLGEFEQGRPLIEALKDKQDCQIVLTFFSPSGYEIRKNYSLANLVCYLPVDTQKNASRFFELVQPTAAFFIKYEFWANYILTANKQDVPIYSVAAVFRKKQLFFKWYGGFMRSVLQKFDQIFVQDSASKQLLSSINIESVLSGDTRYDRVMKNAKTVQSYPLIEKFIANQKVLVIGSSWEADENLISKAFALDSFEGKIIIAPHEIGAERIAYVERVFVEQTVRYSQLDAETAKDSTVLIIDNIGMLMNVYQYADIAYVGGAFGSGLHNILEPACFGLPVIFGPNYKKFNEAFDFIEHGVGKSVATPQQFLLATNEFTKAQKSSAVIAFMEARQGATELILKVLKK